MKIPTAVIESGATKSGLQFIKASALGAKPNETDQQAQIRRLQLMGKTVDFTMSGDIEANGPEPESGKPDVRLWSVPVVGAFDGQKLQGQYSLNKTALRILSSKLGADYESWNGVRFTSFIGPQRNPRSNEQTIGFSILADSVHPAKSR